MIIELSGVDGSGKSTQANLLTRWAVDRRLVAVECSLRSSTRRMCQGIAIEHGMRSWREMFRSDQVEFSSAIDLVHQATTSVVLADAPGHLLVVDQYLRTWQARCSADTPALSEALSHIYGKLPAPAVSFHLAIDPAVAHQRVRSRPKGDHTLRFGGLARLTTMAQALDAAASASPYPCIVLDATQPADILAGQVSAAVSAALPASL